MSSTPNSAVFRPLLVAPSILSADFSKLGEEVAAIDRAGCDRIHIDVMDGHFVPNITVGPQIVEALRPLTAKTLDVHLMISPYDRYLESFARSGSDIITIHVEAGSHPDRALRRIRELGKKAGISINPSTSDEALRYMLDTVDQVLIMSVNPGFGGQGFISSTLEKISHIREMIGDRDIDIAVDGGINPDIASHVAHAGANVLIAGAAVFHGGAERYQVNIRAIRQSAEEGRRIG